jgi:isoleucyl-tRNA synthetase
MSFKKVDPKLTLAQEEEKILEYWAKNDTFKKTLEKDSPKGDFVFYEGPPTANGKPGLHHVLARAFKDLFVRYKTMQGYHVTRKAGWDTHGLPVELQVERELGISGKQQIENIVKGDKYASIEKFNKLCKESVWEYKSEWEKMTERMAYWVDMKDPYVTYDPKYIESVWWIIGQINDKGLLYKSYKVVPFCPRCGTALSSHEVALGYQEVSEETVYVVFKSTKEKDINFLVWTTTPWTLAGNSALAFGPKMNYVLAEKGGFKFVLGENRVEAVLGENHLVLERFTGEELVERFGTESLDYEPLYGDALEFAEAGDKAYELILADYVTDDDGTGIVHIAPAFGEEDYIFGYEKNGIKILKTVSEQGIELAGAGKGKFVKEADKDVLEDLARRELLFKTEKYAHDYPFCWRCESPLLYLARNSWYIATTKVKDELLANNEKINWNPKHTGSGRFGNWIENNIDWALSRDRYWGTPLPVWECEDCKKYKVVTSLSEVDNVEPHRPYIDKIEFDCECGGKMKRTPEVIDVWFDSGSMPYAQYHYPFENKELQQNQYPADYICEAVDQTRGWFYTLHAISTLVSNSPAYKNVISTGHVLDEKGQKMSKSKGNIIAPDDAFQRYGADVVRYFFFSVNKPEEPKLFIEKEVLAVSRNLFLTLWNVYSFFVMYAEIDKFKPTGKLKPENVLDRWVISKFNELVKEVTKSMDKYDPYRPSMALIDFVNELSTWYVRRSRRRFWKSENDNDKGQAYETLYHVLKGLAALLAPFTPMYAEVLYQGLRQKDDPESVHLLDYPAAGEVDKGLLEAMKDTRTLVSFGLESRARTGIKVRQPLKTLKAIVKHQISDEMKELIKEEVNVKEVEIEVKREVPHPEAHLDTEITKELAQEGLARESVRTIQEMRKKAGFEVADRIEVFFETKEERLLEVFTGDWREYIRKETLAVNITPEKVEELDYNEDAVLEKQQIWVGLKRKK